MLNYGFMWQQNLDKDKDFIIGIHPINDLKLILCKNCLAI